MRSIRRAFLFSLGLACGVAVAIFMGSNTGEVIVTVYPGQRLATPVWVLVLVSFVIGAVLPVLVAVFSGLETFLDRRRLSRRIHELEEELVELRNLPLTEARIDLERPSPPIRPLVDEPREVDAEVVLDDDIPEADLYPAVFDKRGA